jgi:hypothetical protein
MSKVYVLYYQIQLMTTNLGIYSTKAKAEDMKQQQIKKLNEINSNAKDFDIFGIREFIMNDDINISQLTEANEGVKREYNINKTFSSTNSL